MTNFSLPTHTLQHGEMLRVRHFMVSTAPQPSSSIFDAEVPSVSSDALGSMIAALEEDVVFGRLHPRERLVEDELIERFGVKRHIVREALAALDRMGLVERRKNVGALVRSFTSQEVLDLYEMRELLETQAVLRIPMPVSPHQLDRLVAIQQQHDAAVIEGDARKVFRANLSFHQELFSFAGNDTLRMAIAEYARQTHPIRFASLVSPQYRQQARTEHWQMIEALRAGERQMLGELCAAHLLPSRDAYLNAQRHRSS